MSLPTSARALVLKKYVDYDEDLAFTISSHFALKTIPIPNPLPNDSLLVKTLLLSNDPGQRIWMQELGELSASRPEMATVRLGEPEIPGFPLSSLLGSLGISGATAYVALHFVLKPKPTDTLVVSGAAGAVGNVAVQYAKEVMGIKRVVGIAGSEEKCKWLKSIGTDEAVNYKSTTFNEDFAKATPDKVDSFFDNVGGTILDEVLGRMNPKGKIAAVGVTSVYNSMDHPIILKNYVKAVADSVTIYGYNLEEYLDHIPEAIDALADAADSGKLIIDSAETVVDIHDHLEEIPRIWVGMFTGANKGKVITKLAD
ncbi:NAD-binding protein [Fomitiporia mediterranea MF3/22]|uniref:NAD-binding protein n=1 Tax=Fomitiporia mediterranea (strain MF3/22) TaxID=694068 RepID=UPI0004408CBD|nr:NAD-binding protein [Fomitiporia mediterranea MF3/22]EJD02363.1 NAD-binding protein [Fomitiporia mediterranea MF3/22]